MNQQKYQAPDTGMLVRAARSLQLVWRLVLDPRVPFMTKLILVATAVYVVSPIDAIPDVIPVLGQLDDLGVILLGIKFFIQMCPANVVMEHQQALGISKHARSDEYVDATYRVVDDDRQR